MISHSVKSSSSHAGINKKNGKKEVILGFNSQLCSTSETLECNIIMAKVSDYKFGPLLDDGAAYKAIGEHELKLLQTRNPSEDYDLESKIFKLHHYKYWQ